MIGHELHSAHSGLCVYIACLERTKSFITVESYRQILCSRDWSTHVRTRSCRYRCPSPSLIHLASCRFCLDTDRGCYCPLYLQSSPQPLQPLPRSWDSRTHLLVEHSSCLWAAACGCKVVVGRFHRLRHELVRYRADTHARSHLLAPRLRHPIHLRTLLVCEVVVDDSHPCSSRI